jgi:hypothetical protein
MTNKDSRREGMYVGALFGLVGDNVLILFDASVTFVVNNEEEKFF